MHLGTTIKKLRKDKGVKQNVFAKECNISPAYLSQIENNLKEPNISTLKTISKKLDIPLPVLFFLSLERKDLAPSKREAFDILVPSINSMLQAFFKTSIDSL